MYGRAQQNATDDDEIIATANESAFDLSKILSFVTRRWKFIVSTAVLVAMLALVVVLSLTPRYTATTEVLLEAKKEGFFGRDTIAPELNLDTGSIDSQVAVILSIGLLRRVVEQFNLTADTEFGAKKNSGLLASIRGLFVQPEAGRSDRDAATDQIPPDLLRTIIALRGALRVFRVGRTYVIEISVTSEDPEKAMRLTNGIADAYVVDRLEARYDAARRASTWLAERLEGLREQVRASEEAVAKFRQENNLTVSSEGTVAITEQQLSELSAKLITARSETAEKRAKYEQAQIVQDSGGNLQAIPDVVRSTVISDLRKQEAEVTRRVADLAARYSDAHPTVVNARAERRDIERNISAEVARIITNLRNDFNVALAREQSLQSSMNALTGQGGRDGTLGIRLRELERTATANRTLFEGFLSRAKIAQEQTAFEQREARVISPASRPISPSFPRKSLILVAALLAGAGLGLCGAIALELLNSGFSTSTEVENVLGRPILSSIPLLPDSERRFDGKVVTPSSYLVRKPLSRYAEQIRSVRVGVQMADVDNPAKVVLVTSSAPKEGKSTIASCLALSAAKAGQRVLLIDGDLRRPALSKQFGLDAHAGLVDYLTGATSLGSALVAAESLIVLPSGSRSQNPADLLGSDRMKQMVAELRSNFDYIVIDSPPICPVVDAKIVQYLADKVIYVVRWNATPREVVIDGLKKLGAERRLAGIAFNLVDEKKAARYGTRLYDGASQYKSYYQS